MWQYTNVKLLFISVTSGTAINLYPHYLRYSYLWKDDAHHVFSQFINGRSLPVTVNSREPSEDGQAGAASRYITKLINLLLRGCNYVTDNLAIFRL